MKLNGKTEPIETRPIKLPETHSFEHRGYRWTWFENGVYAYVEDEKGHQLFAFKVPAASDDMLRAAMDVYYLGHGRGHAVGMDAKLTEIQNALGIERDNRLG